MAANRDNILNQLAQLLAEQNINRPIRVAIDGRTASGKTTFANELASAIEKLGRPTIRTSIDGFHRPKVERYARGRFSPEGYYFDARDLPAVRKLLLDPLGPKGNRQYRTASFDLQRDQPIEQEPRSAPHDAILIVDGTFLLRPELEEAWDIAVFLKTTEEVAETRGVNRDAANLGGATAAKKLYSQRYRPAFALYDELCQPQARADVVVDNSDFDYPDLMVKQVRSTVASLPI